MRIKRQSLLPGFKSQGAGRAHGGDLATGKRKTYRPIDPKQALHVVLRSSRARGELSMLRPRACNAIERFLREVARRRGVRVYRYANVGNHLHLLIRAPSRAACQRFLREFAGGVAILVTGATKGSALARDSSRPESAQRGFWDGLVFTRIVRFGRDFDGVARYLIKNLFEAAGVPVQRLLAQGYRILTLEKDGAISGAPP